MQSFTNCKEGDEYELNYLFVLVGISGSGKSWFANESLKEDFEVFSSDAIRAEVFGEETDQTHNQKVFEILHKRLRIALKNGKNCIYDATNLNRKRRITFLKSIQDIDCKKCCFVVATPFELCVERDKNRARSVGEKVIRRQISQFQLPLLEEGWDEVLIHHNDEIDYPSIYNYFPEEDVPHDCAPYHYEGITEHMDMTLRELLKTDKVTLALVEATSFHDVGKFYTKSFYDKKGNRKNRATYYGHENWSAYLYMTSSEYWNLNGVIENGAPSIGDGALYLIALHMELYREGKILDKLSPECLEALRVLKECDDKGRLTSTKF